MAMPEEKVLEKLNVVSTSKRLANMVRLGLKTARFFFLRERQELHDSNFGKREEIQKLKSKRKLEGDDRELM